MSSETLRQVVQQAVCMQELKRKTLIGVATQFDATNPNTKPKIGFAFDLKN